eukprot:GHVN01093869.1.p1 GENE.GHVN01093869.1~~GHVN01093869.1.p1  ORF type:complete len:582 (+),score=85.65 GHVN01093869.1:50-1795(+)
MSEQRCSPAPFIEVDYDSLKLPTSVVSLPLPIRLNNKADSPKQQDFGDANPYNISSCARVPQNSTHCPSTLRELLLVEIPGRVSDVPPGALPKRSPVDALGGEGAVAASWRDNAKYPLVLRFFDGDRYSKFVPATPDHTSSLVLKIQKMKDGKCRICVVGTASQRFRFDLPADYMMVPPPSCRNEGVINTINETIGGQPRPVHPWFCPPPIFTKFHTPFDYKYEDNVWFRAPTPTAVKRLLDVGEDGEEGVDDEVALGRRGFNKVARFADEVLPGVTPGNPTPSSEPLTLVDRHDDQSLKGVGDMENGFDAVQAPKDPTRRLTQVVIDVEPDAALSHLLSVISKLMNDRPMWRGPLLELELTKELGNVTISAWRRRPAFARSCFLFVDGPWRGCLCRLGYDPRIDPEARKFQTIDFRDPYFRSRRFRSVKASADTRLSLASLKEGNNAQRATDAHTAESVPFVGGVDNLTKGFGLLDAEDDTPYGRTLAEIEFRTPPARLAVLYQLCDIRDAAVAEIISSPQYVSKECTRQNGWLDPCVLPKIREVLTMRANRLRWRQLSQQQHQPGGETDAGTEEKSEMN